MLKLRVPDMTCGHCAHAIEGAVKDLDPQAQVEVYLAQKVVSIRAVAPERKLSEAVRSAGYENQTIPD